MAMYFAVVLVVARLHERGRNCQRQRDHVYCTYCIGGCGRYNSSPRLRSRNYQLQTGPFIARYVLAMYFAVVMVAVTHFHER